MASERKKQFRGSERPSRGATDEWSADVQKLPHQAPQFSTLAKVAEKQGPEPSPSQQKFLDDFAGRLTEGVSEDGGASATADVDGRGKESRGT